MLPLLFDGTSTLPQTRRVLLGLLMGANRDFGILRLDSPAIEIKPAILPLCGPGFFKSMRLIGAGDAETPKRQDHRANTDMRVRARANVPAPRTLKNCGPDAALRSNSLQHRVQVVT